MVRFSRSASTSTHCPRISAKPLVPASRAFTSAAVSGSPSKLTCMLKSNSASVPNSDGVFAPTMPVTFGRGGRFARHVAGMRTTTPACSRVCTSRSKHTASAGDQRSGWKISPASTISFNQAHSWEAR